MLNDRPYMTIVVYRGRKTTQQQHERAASRPKPSKLAPRLYTFFHAQLN